MKESNRPLPESRMNGLGDDRAYRRRRHRIEPIVESGWHGYVLRRRDNLLGFLPWPAVWQEVDREYIRDAHGNVRQTTDAAVEKLLRRIDERCFSAAKDEAHWQSPSFEVPPR